MNFLEVPTVMLIQVFEYLSYEEVSKKRLVCRKIDQICQHILNCGFNKIVRQHTVSFKRIKALLPRRESERRNHCLARHADILTSIETRISMLSMTYTKYMDLNLCCFIPGRVLDEIIRILRLISKTSKPLRPHEVLQELRDISSMAIEHFDEKIANTLKKTFVDCGQTKMCSSTDNTKMSASASTSASISGFSGGLCGSSSSPVSCGVWNSSGALSPPNSTLMNSRCDAIRQRVNALISLGQTGLLDSIKRPVIEENTTEASEQQQHGCPEARATMMYFKKLEFEYKKGIVKMHRMQQIQTHQSRRLQQALTSVSELNVQIIELKKRLEDIDAKNREISANIKQINTGDACNVAGADATVDENKNMAIAVVPTLPATSQSCSSANECELKINDDVDNSIKKSTKRRFGEGVTPVAVTSCVDTASDADETNFLVGSTKRPKI